MSNQIFQLRDLANERAAEARRLSRKLASRAHRPGRSNRSGR